MIRLLGRLTSFATALALLASSGTVAIASSTAELRGTELLTALQAGKFSDATAHFDSTMKAALTPEQLAKTWQQMVDGNGKLLSWKITPPTGTGAMDVIIAPLKFQHSSALAAQIAVNRNSGEIAGLFFVPDPDATTPAPYVDADKFHSEEVKVGSGSFTLRGTLTVPKAGKGPWPAVVMLSGSGPNDQDETIGPNRPFKDIAEGLSSRGIVVLRYDKRTHDYAKKMDLQRITVTEEYLDDAIAAVNMLRADKRVDRNRIFVAGHSLGATIAPEVALKAAPVQGLILMAPTARKFGRTVVEQMRFLEEGSHQQLDLIERKANELDNHLMPPTENFMGAPASYYYDLDARNEVAMAAQLGVPILILRGGRDYQVIDKDIKHWQEGLKGVGHVRVETFPALNHLFIPGTGKPNREEYVVPGHVDEKVVAAMAAFIQNPLSH